MQSIKTASGSSSHLRKLILTALLTTFLSTQSCNCNAVAAKIESETPQKTNDDRRSQGRERIEQIIKESHERFEKVRENRLLESNMNYAKAFDEYNNLIKSNKNNGAEFIKTAMNLAVAAFRMREYSRANQVYSEAVSAYLALKPDATGEQECRRIIWQHMGYFDPSTFQSRFSELFKSLEQRTTGSMVRDLTNALDNVPSEQNVILRETTGYTRDHNDFDSFQFYKSAIDVRSAVRGANDPSLRQLMEQYARICEQKNNIAEAENVIKRLAGLKGQNAEESSILAQIDLAKFYLRRSMSEKALTAYKTAWSQAKNQLTPNLVSQLIALSSEFKSHGQPDVSDELLANLMNSVTSEDSMRNVDQALRSTVDSCMNSFDLTRAQSLLMKRVNATKRLGNDREGNHWKLKLSEVDLALGQESESNLLFNQVKTSYALTNQDVDKLVSDRQKLIENLNANRSGFSPSESKRPVARTSQKSK